MQRGAHHFLREYLAALLRTPQIFRHTAFRTRTLEEELNEALLRGSLRKAFGGWDLLLLGLGVVIGSGWAQLSGFAAQQFAGPSVIVSYVVSGMAALFASICYAELCVEYPVSGGAFSYVMITFGELAAYVTLAGLLLEYALGMAAVARGFSSYLARLCNLDPTFFIVDIQNTQHSLDFMAAGIILLMSVLLSLGVRESAFFISAVTAVKIILLLFVSIVGYTQGSISNITPFLHPDYGVDGIFMGAAAIFFSYSGFDAVCNAAEEAQNVAHLPWAVVGTASISMGLYFLLAMSLVLMAYPSASDPQNLQAGKLTFITSFLYHSQKWMQYVVAITALSGILTALTVGMFSVSRIVMVASRDWLLPPFLARISPRTQTPLMAQMVFGVIIALLAMLVEVDLATSLVAFGTLVALWLVCNAQLYRRYSPDVQLRFTRYGMVETAPKAAVSSWVPGRRLPVHTRKLLLLVHVVALNVACIALAAYYQATVHLIHTTTTIPAPQVGVSSTAVSPPPPASLDPSGLINDDAPQAGHQGLGTLWFALGWLLVTLSFQLCCPLEYEPTGWHVPWWLMPWLPSTAIGLVAFSVGALPTTDYWKIGSYFGTILAVYLLFSLPMSYIKHSRVDYVNTEELNVVELAFVNGQWQPARPQSLYLSTPPILSPANSRDSEYKFEVASRAGSMQPAGNSGSLAAGGIARSNGGTIAKPVLPPTNEVN